MSESLGIDSPQRGLAMPKSYSGDLRARVTEAVEMGASRREAAERFEIGASTAVKWLQRWRDSRSAAPKPREGSVSPLEQFWAPVLAVVSEQPDLTLLEAVAKLRRQRIRTSRSSLWRFLDRHDITLKKSLQAAERRRADVARARRRWIREQGMLDTTRLVFIDETAVATNMVRIRGRAPRGVRLIGEVPLAEGAAAAAIWMRDRAGYQDFAPTFPDRPRKSAGDAIESQATANLKPWREVVTPHKNVASGRYQRRPTSKRSDRTARPLPKSVIDAVDGSSTGT